MTSPAAEIRTPTTTTSAMTPFDPVLDSDLDADVCVVVVGRTDRPRTVFGCIFGWRELLG